MTNDPSSNDKPNELSLLWRASDAASSELAFRELLPAAQLLEGRARSHLIDLHVYIARSEMAQGKLAEAGGSMKTAECLFEEQQASYPVSSRIRWLLESGRLLTLMKTPSQAHARLGESWTLAVNSGEDSLAIEVALLMATVESPKLQQEWIIRAIRIAEGSPQANAKRWLGSLYSALGWKLYDLRQFESALSTFQKALSHLKSDGTEREVFVAKWSVGKLLRTMGQPGDALVIQNALLAEIGVGSPKDGRLFEELAECLFSLKRLPEAQVYFDLAYRELASDEWVVDNQPALLKRLKDLGKSK